MGVDELIASLDAFVPSADDVANVDDLYTMLASFGELPDRERALPALFRVIERDPGADLGHPGPLVSSIETVPGYQAQLRESVLRTPTYLNTWMLNRILNGPATVQERADFLDLLQDVVDRTDADPVARSSAISFLEHQRGSA